MCENREANAKNEASIADTIGFQKEVMAEMEALIELLPVVEKFHELCVDAEKNARLVKVELSLVKHQKKYFDEAIVAANKKLSAAKLECKALQWSWDDVLSKLKVLMTDLEESLNAVSKRKTENSSLMSKQFVADVDQSLERIFVEFKDGAAKIFGGFRTSLSGSTSGTQRKSSNFVAMWSNRLASVRWASSVKPFAFASGMSAVAAGTAPLTSAIQIFEGSPQFPDTFQIIVLVDL